ncbi:molybdate ABC transporter substrate-binding protein [Blastochloris tepida]|uniref:Molybdate ABC transporter substrate-binding protein n=1 Tax=Blastochloris tepida TaxID=2233851 RepID=A0A348G3S1_9HYPH|nr:molybdate ABC transporter substrate-binding protein [Blastochloris tepida]BBF94204.1 hypothetical protein BLTE_28890 [Blastochloris tepida]
MTDHRSAARRPSRRIVLTGAAATLLLAFPGWPQAEEGAQTPPRTPSTPPGQAPANGGGQAPSQTPSQPPSQAPDQEPARDGGQERPAARPLSVLAADPLRPTLDDIVGLYTAASGLRVTVTYGPSDSLVETLDQGGAADLFISDVRGAMELAVERRLVKAESRRSLASNRLVLVAPKDSSLIEVLLGPGTRLSTLAGQGRIAVGAAQAMPGAVVRAALESLGLWADAEPCLTAVETSRAAVAMVGRGEAPLGIVFVSDARSDPAVKVVGIFPETSHRPIVYEGALTATAGISAPALLDFIQSAAARAAFEKAGYLTLK